MGLFKSLSQQLFDGARDELMKDRNKNGAPDAIEHLNTIEKGVDFIGEIAKTLDRADIKKLLKAGNIVIGNKVPPDQIDRWANGIAAIGPASDAIVQYLNKVEEALENKGE